MLSRFGSPGFFVLALICFCLPWIEIKCNQPRGGLFSGQGDDVFITTQSGLQMTTGDFTTVIVGRAPTEQEKLTFQSSNNQRPRAAPAMIVYGACLVAGLAAGLIVSRKVLRTALVTLASSCATAILIFQLAIGFPLVEGIPRENSSMWKYTPWFWLAIAATLGAGATAMSENFWQLAKNKNAKQVDTVQAKDV